MYSKRENKTNLYIKNILYRSVYIFFFPESGDCTDRDCGRPCFYPSCDNGHGESALGVIIYFTWFFWKYFYILLLFARRLTLHISLLLIDRVVIACLWRLKLNLTQIRTLSWVGRSWRWHTLCCICVFFFFIFCVSWFIFRATSD